MDQATPKTFVFEAWNYLKLFEYVIVISSWDTSFRVCLKFNRLLNMAELSFQYVYRLLTILSPVYFGLCNNNSIQPQSIIQIHLIVSEKRVQPLKKRFLVIIFMIFP